MSTAIDLDLAAVLRAAALDDCDRLLSGMRPAAVDATAVHDARKACKRLRAWLRLMRALHPDSARALERRVKAAADALREVREADVRRQTLARLAGDDAALDETLSRLQAATPGPPSARRLTAAGRRAAAQMREVRGEIAALDLDGVDVGVLERGLRASYRKTRRAMRAIDDGLDGEAMHGWRKQLRRHSDQCRLLAPLWPALAGKRRKQLKKVNDVLGDHHDDADLLAWIADIDLDDEHRDALRARLIADQGRLAARAFEYAGDRFDRKPKHWSPGAA